MAGRQLTEQLVIRAHLARAVELQRGASLSPIARPTAVTAVIAATSDESSTAARDLPTEPLLQFFDPRVKREDVALQLVNTSLQDLSPLLLVP